jgi:PAS domain S-box-containing protein
LSETRSKRGSDQGAGPKSEPAEDLEDLFENAPCGYLSLKPSGAIFRCNATFSSWIGFPAQQLAGKRFQDLLNVAGRIFYETHFAPLLRMQGVFNEVALDLVRHDGQPLPVLVNAVERRDDNGQLLFTRLTIFNATDRRRYERELLAARAAADAASSALHDLNIQLEARVVEAVEERMKTEEALRQSQKMEAVGQLTGGVAHDFNNLLTIIIGGLDSIRRQVEKLPDGPELARIRRAQAMALHGAERAAALTARLLAFSRRRALDPKPLDANRLVAGLADLLQRTLGETIALEAVSGAGLWRAFADPVELENVLINLAVNARDAMPNGGRLTIETGNAFLDEAYVEALAEPVAPGQYILIAVSDTGQGMNEETLARVFEPFFTTKASGRGTGLGLSQVSGFVRQSGGHIRIYSEVGEGTSVKVYLPRAPADAAERPESEPLLGASTEGGAETILVVEDHEELRAFSAGVLRELGYNVVEASSGRLALEVLQTRSNLDLLFTDMVLPDGMSGRELADEARRRQPGLKVLFTTGYTRNAVVHNGKLDAGVNLISKPFTYDQLAAKVRTLLD